MNKKVLIRVVVFVVIVSLISVIVHWKRTLLPANLDANMAQVSLRLPIPVVDTSFSPYYLAQDKGFFLKHKLNVTLEPGTPELNPVKMLTQGVDEFAVLGGPELLFSARAKGAPLVAIALIHKDSDFVVIVSPKSSGLIKVSQLKGKKVGFFYGHISTDILHMLLEREKVGVEEVDVGFNYGPLISGELDAQWAFRTTAGISLPAKGYEINIISPADYGIVTQGHVLVTTEKMIKEQPEIVQNFLNAIMDSLSYSLDHVQEAIDSAVVRDPTFQPSVGRKQLEIYNKAIRNNARLGLVTEDMMEKTKVQMTEVGILPIDFDVRAAYTTRFIEECHTGN
jgi:NitT/TauT family transport system substrate-binding protein